MTNFENDELAMTIYELGAVRRRGDHLRISREVGNWSL